MNQFPVVPLIGTTADALKGLETLYERRSQVLFEEFVVLVFCASVEATRKVEASKVRIRETSMPTTQVQ